MNSPTPVCPPSVEQLSRIEELRDVLYKRLLAARASLDEDINHLQLTTIDECRGNVEIANSVELDLLRSLVNSTRPCPLILTK